MSVLWQGIARHRDDPRRPTKPRTVTLLPGDIVLRNARPVYVYGGQVLTAPLRDRKGEWEAKE